MKIEVNKEIVRKSIKYYGSNLQSVVAMEECAELIQAISKGIRGKLDLHNMTEEIADVLIGVEILKYVYGITDSDIDDMITCKQERILHRMHVRKDEYDQVHSGSIDPTGFLIDRFTRKE